MASAFGKDDMRRGFLSVALPAALAVALLAAIPSKSYSFKAARRDSQKPWAAFVEPDAADYSRMASMMRTSWQLSARARFGGSPDPASGLYVLEDKVPQHSPMELPGDFSLPPPADRFAVPDRPLSPLPSAADAVERLPAMPADPAVDAERAALRRQLLDPDSVRFRNGKSAGEP